MRKQSVTMEWAIGDDLPDLLQGRVASGGEAIADRVLAPKAEVIGKEVKRAEIYLVALVTTIFVFLATGWLWEKHNRVTALVDDLEDVARQATPPYAPQPQQMTGDVFVGVSGGQLSAKQAARSIGAPAIHIESYQRLGNRIMAHMTISHTVSGETFAYRETRFFAQNGEAWQEIDADPDLMGPVQTLATEHFTLRFRAVDAPAVQAVASRLEALYGGLRHSFGLAAIETSGTYAIQLAIEPPLSSPQYHFGTHTITVPSPTLLSVPATMEPETVLEESIRYLLARSVVIETIDQEQGEWKSHFMQWHPMRNALHLWAVWRGGGPLATGRADVVRWLLALNPGDSRLPPMHLPSAHLPSTHLPSTYADLCRTYEIWRMSPRDLFIPLACNADDQNSPSTGDFNNGSAWKPERFTFATVTLEDAFDSSVALATVIEYIIASYGTEALPLFLAALGEHTQVHALIPAVFEVSTLDFEQGWRAYLVEQYQVE